MSLDVWFRADVIRILNALHQAALRQQGSDSRDGYLDALADVGAAFGLHAPMLEPDQSGKIDLIGQEMWT
jgi:hypothetical protein